MPGLCSCRVVLRAGVSLPLSIAEPSEENDPNESSGDNGGNKTSPSSSSSSSFTRSRWLVQVKAAGGELTLSLLRPSRAGTPSGGLDVQGPAHQPKHMLRQPRSLVATWEDWAWLGYGPLEWMSHAQKALVARLSLFWILLKPPTCKEPLLEGRRYENMKKKVFRFPEEAFLRLRPILYRASRPVGTPGETLASARRGGGLTRPSTSGGTDSGRERLRAAVMLTRDEGSVFRVEVEVGVEVKVGGGGEGQSKHGGGVERLEQTFGKEVWQETGLEELLWLDCSGRQYLARRLAQQVWRESRSVM